MPNFKQIIEAWIIAGNPTDAQRELAELRGKICDKCPSKKVVTKKLQLGTICNECGCPIAKKIFTNEYNPCPLFKWAEIDRLYFPEKTKKSKTLF
jgi:hypothetical protein